MIETVTKFICDNCNAEILSTEKYVNAEHYGTIFHYDCFKSLSAFQLVKKLDLSRIVVIRELDWATAEKVTDMVKL